MNLISSLPATSGHYMENKILYKINCANDASIFFRVRSYKERKYIDLRLFFQPKDSSDMFPTRKGITIHSELFTELKKGIEACEKELAQNPPQTGKIAFTK